MTLKPSPWQRWMFGAACALGVMALVAWTQFYRSSSKVERPVVLPGELDYAAITRDEWRSRLTPEQFYVMREMGTERPYANAYAETKTPGVYRCAGCGWELFHSDHKFDSGTGWPSYYQPANEQHVETETDYKLFVPRTEVHCARCLGHLGHVFDDGPPPTGLRYCINSAALVLEPSE